MKNEGLIYRISGPVVTAINMKAAMYDVVRVGTEGLMGEVIELHGDQSVIQVYEETSGVRPGEPVIRTGQTLSVQLGPGLLTKIYDGIQRPLPELEKTMGVFITRGVDADGLDLEKNWNFNPTVKVGDNVKKGDVICKLDPEDRVARLDEAIANEKQAQLKFDATVALAKEGYRSENAVASAEAILKGAVARREIAENAVNNTMLKAPFDGFVEDINVKVGDLISPSQMCGSIIQLDPMIVSGEVTEKNIVQMIIDNSKSYEIDVTAEDYHGRTGFQIARNYGETDIVNLIRKICPSIAVETTKQQYGM